MKKKKIALELFRHLISHNWHGYSQVSRWGDGEGTCPVAVNGNTYRLEQGDRDCSSAIISAYEAAGISCGGATYTGNMRACMVGTGNFRWHPMSSGYVAQPGDVYLNELYHTAMCTSAVPDLLGEFSISETGGIDGVEGDQTGNESHERTYYNYPWDGILECINNEEDKSVSNAKTPKQVAGNAVNNLGLNYRAHCQTTGTLPVVHDGQTAGTVGYGKRLEALWIDLRKIRKLYPSVKLKAKVHIQSIGWTFYDNVEHDTVLGTTGKAKRIEAIELEMEGLPEDKKLYYRTHLAKTGWTPWVQGGFSSGSVGLSKAIEAMQIKIV